MNQYLTFMLGSETFGLGIVGIKEIIQYGGVTAVPRMPSFIRGVINLRGAVVPVIDLGARFGRGETEMARRTCIIIIEVGEGEDKQDVGVMVDAVNAVIDIADEDIEAPPSFGARIRTDFIRGMGKLGERFVVILEINAVLSLDEMVTLTAMGAEEAVV